MNERACLYCGWLFEPKRLGKPGLALFESNQRKLLTKSQEDALLANLDGSRRDYSQDAIAIAKWLVSTETA